MTTPLRARRRNLPAAIKMDGDVTLFTTRNGRDRWHMANSAHIYSLLNKATQAERVWLEYEDGEEVPAEVLTFDNGSAAIKTYEDGRPMIQVWWRTQFHGARYSDNYGRGFNNEEELQDKR